MKNAILLHGTSCSPESYWFPSIRHYLEGKGYNVWVPQLPDSDVPDLKKQLPYVLNDGKFNEHTVIIGHSAGGPLTLSVLERIDIKKKKEKFVGGPAKAQEDRPNTK